jgi:hypothetical protein
MRFPVYKRYYLVLLLLAVVGVAFAFRNRQVRQVTIAVKKRLAPVVIDSQAVNLKPKGTYALQRQRIATAQARLRQKYLQAPTPVARQQALDSARNYLQEAVVNQLVPHWYGTPWNFEGYTETPQKGHIACGYFVSTVLNHAGLKINRFKMAQQSPENEIRTLHQQPQAIDFHATSVQAFEDSVRTNLTEGLYIFGLSNHVGFMLYHANKIYFIHSSGFVPDFKVVIEPAGVSLVLSYPQDCLLGAITPNDALVKQWLLGETVVVQN